MLSRKNILYIPQVCVFRIAACSILTSNNNNNNKKKEKTIYNMHIVMTDESEARKK